MENFIFCAVFDETTWYLPQRPSCTIRIFCSYLQDTFFIKQIFSKVEFDFFSSLYPQTYIALIDDAVQSGSQRQYFVPFIVSQVP